MLSILGGKKNYEVKKKKRINKRTHRRDKKL